MAIGRHHAVRHDVLASLGQWLKRLRDVRGGDDWGTGLPLCSGGARDDDGDELRVHRLGENELDGSGWGIEFRAVGRCAGQ